MAKAIRSPQSSVDQRRPQLSSVDASLQTTSFPGRAQTQGTKIGGSAPRSKEVSLRQRLLLSILPVVLVPLVLAGAIGYRIIEQRSEEQVQEQLENQALLTSEGATAVLEDLLDLPQAIAASPLVVNEAQAGSRQVTAEGLDQLAIELLEDRFAETKLLRVHNRLNAYLRETIETADISEISITERHGFNVAYSEPTTDFVQSDEVWWQEGKEKGQWIGSPDFDFAAKGFTVELAQAIRDPISGDFVGVVRAVLPTRKFSLLAQYIKRTVISGSQKVQLIDGTSLKVIDSFSPEGFRKDRDIIGGKPVEQLISAFIETAQPERDSQAILDDLKNSSSVEHLAITFADETATVASFVHNNRQYKLSSIPNTQWVAIASMDTAEISGAGRDSLMFLAITISLLAGITGTLILWLARQLSMPLGSLADQAQLVAAGDFNVAVTPRGTKETRALTRSFNQLVVQVKDLLTQQEAETQKAQLFATITGASATAIADLRPILEKVLPEARRLLKADRMLFYPVNIKQLAAEATAPGTLSGLEQAMLADCIPETLLNAKPNSFPWVVADVTAAELNAQHQDYLQALDVHSTLTMPVFNEDALFGFFIAHTQSSRQWQPSEQAFITQLAGQFKLVVDRVAALKKIQETRQVAAVLTGEKHQQSIELSQHKEQLAQQSEVLLRQNEELRRQQSELSQQSAEQRRQKEQLQHQIALLVEDIQGISHGDLTVRARVAEGELKTIADVFNLTVARLQTLVSQVKQSSTQVSTILTQNEGTAIELTNATRHQAQEAAKTLGTVQSMIDSMGAIAENAQMAAVTAKTVASTAEASEAGMNRTAERILRLSEVCTHAVNQLENLGDSAHHVNHITATIREIAVIASLLLDQAQSERSSLEANGQFKVMIQELSQLTERALDETQEAEVFLQKLQLKTVHVAGDIQRVSNQVAEGNQLVNNSKCDLEEVAVVARRFDHLAQSIAKATFSQSQISQAVSTLVKEVAELSEQTVTFSQKMERALHETVDMAQGLQESVSLFKVEDAIPNKAD
ncbi:MAG: GAF domain-containing protein [Leptolyngbyaceae cyanobacterium]